MEFGIVLLMSLLAGTLSGVIGTGSSMLLMPVLVIIFGPQEAVPVMAIGAVMGNLGKVIAWWRLINWVACGAYCSTAVPGAVIGVQTLLAIPPHAIEVALGIFFVTMIPVRRWLSQQAIQFSPKQLALIGGPVGFLTGIVVSTGPISVLIFVGYGLERGAFLSTEAAASIAVYIAKVLTFKISNALPFALVLKGLIVGVALMSGTFLAKSLVLRMSIETFQKVMDGLMLFSGLSLFWAAIR